MTTFKERMRELSDECIVTIIDDTLPYLYIPYPTCGHCGNDVTIEDDSAHCETCNIQWESIREDAEVTFTNEDDDACEIEAAELVQEYDYNGNHWRLEFKPCILPSGHGGACLWPQETTITPIATEPKERAMTDHQYPVALRGAKHETLMWAHEHEIESQALNQLRNIAALPWVHGLRVMPDVHFGKGATVGSVIAMEQAISPSAVGVDIGCGVNAVRTSLTASDLPDDLRGIRVRIESLIPVGFSAHDKEPKVTGSGWGQFWGRFRDLHTGVQQFETRAQKSMGTLGSGNHFIELCLDAEDRVWMTLHSGSRGIGKELAERHIAIAKGLPHNQDLPDRDLAVFFRDTPQMQSYLHDLRWAQEFAMRSRSVMMGLFKQALREKFEAITFDDEINCHHNYVSDEEIDGRSMLVTRKGAIFAGKNQLALIPGSMGTGSYVVRGLGNPASFQSASHGAGRRLSRGAAKRAFTGDDEGASQIAAQLGAIESRRDSGILDELPEAYKDIHSVIEAQSDLVEVVQHLQTILCVKG